MSAPRWYRGTPEWLWGAVIALALALALWGAGVWTMRAIQADERAAVLREGDALLRQATAHAAQLAHERDSLRQVVARVDTVIVERIRRIRDTAWLPADPSPVVVLAACRAELERLASDCDAFRATATTALAKADTIRRGDSTVIAGLSLQLAAIRRADSVRVVREGRASRWRWVERGALAGSLVANVFLMRR